MTKKLFKEFNAVSAKEWKQKIQFDLKGADYNDTLIWNSLEGIDVKPFYHGDDQKTPQGIKSNATAWEVCQKIYVADEMGANRKATDILSRGAESLWFVLPSEGIDLLKLFKDIDLNKVSIHLEPQYVSADFTEKIKSLALKDTSFYIHNDVIGNLARSGNWFHDEKKDLDVLTTAFGHLPTLAIDATLYQNAGANLVQQLAYSIAHATEYMNVLGNAKNKLNSTVVFKMAVGTNYFFEIAKLRALRLLWHSVATEFGFHPECHILATPTRRNKTLYDYNTNMLRTTTESMSAILGGANTICNLPYDAIYHKDNEFGERISRNQLLILKSESYFDKVDNPADGAYYIEELTQQLAEKALALFKDIEANGGFLKQLKEGTIQRKIKEHADKEQDAFDKNEEVLIGSNKYPNEEDRMKDDLELYPFVKKHPRKTAIVPIIEKRLTEKLEQERLKKE
ncbi:methylmalonyl-CoA mutase subunit beta [Sungkyunkwania multivorans]|uniref:Methylmalonyl-CoA mutase subunit beta n=1 Tax=Sungkyunkwania multivorans TaxID=1173618 RepID=A0ABW3CUA5_9FLAO